MATNWTGSLGSYAQDFFAQPKAASPKKKKRTPGFGPDWGDPNTSTNTAAVDTSTGYSAGKAAPANTTTGPGGQPITSTTKGGQEQYRAPGDFGQAIDGSLMHATPGSFAAGIHGVGNTPDALDYYANNPYAQYGAMASDKFGVPAGGRAQGLFAQYLDPRSKAPGILGDDYPIGSLEWVNFGEQLFGSGKANGTFLSPKAMVQNIVSVLLDATQDMAKGGGGIANEGAWNPVRALVQMGPAEGIKSLLDMLRGALTGTMPDDDLQSYLSWVEMSAQNYMSSYGRGSMGGAFEEQAAGRNWLTNLVNQLGPTLGL